MINKMSLLIGLATNAQVFSFLFPTFQPLHGDRDIELQNYFTVKLIAFQIKMDSILLFLIFILTLIKTSIIVFREFREHIERQRKTARMEMARSLASRRRNFVHRDQHLED